MKVNWSTVACFSIASFLFGASIERQINNCHQELNFKNLTPTGPLTTNGNMVIWYPDWPRTDLLSIGTTNDNYPTKGNP